MKTPKQYHTEVSAAILDGWLRVYEGDKMARGDYRGRIYGCRPGNHRVFRCWKGGAK